MCNFLLRQQEMGVQLKMSKSIILLKNATVPYDPYKETFAEHSLETFFLPLLTHNPINHPEIISFLTSDEFLNDYKSFIITSQRCIESLSIVLSAIKDNEKLNKILNKPAYTVGPATFDVLTRLGFKDIRGGINAGNGSILSDIIIEDNLYKDGNKNILFLTGEIRKDIIPRTLASAGFALKELVAYRTDVMDDVVERYSYLYGQLVKNDNEKWIVFFSPQGTEFITEHLASQKSTFKVASIGPTTEEYLLNKGIKPVFVAKKPNAASLLEGILHL
jgi:uroporphyrinogen-III synthase